MKTIEQVREFIAQNKFDRDTACYIAGYCKAIFGENEIFITFASKGETELTEISQFLKWFEQ